MTEHEASRTLVKSQPELWAQCSDSASLARHLNGSFGEIRITRLEPETGVAWEGERASGTVRLEPSGWGTRVILSARAAAERAASDRAAADRAASDHLLDAPDSVAYADREPPRKSERRRLFSLLRTALRPRSASPAAPARSQPGESAPSGPPEPAESAAAAAHTTEDQALAVEAEVALVQALDSLGRAHHRPFSRA